MPRGKKVGGSAGLAKRRRELIVAEFHGMPAPLLRKVLGVLVKKGQAQMFGTEDEMGVKFF